LSRSNPHQKGVGLVKSFAIHPFRVAGNLGLLAVTVEVENGHLINGDP
jgi:hypothetical protein